MVSVCCGHGCVVQGELRCLPPQLIVQSARWTPPPVLCHGQSCAHPALILEWSFSFSFKGAPLAFCDHSLRPLAGTPGTLTPNPSCLIMLFIPLGRTKRNRRKWKKPCMAHWMSAMRLCAVTVTCLTSTSLPALVLTCWVSMKSPPLCIHLVSTPLQRELHTSSHNSGCSMRNSGWRTQD